MRCETSALPEFWCEFTLRSSDAKGIVVARLHPEYGVRVAGKTIRGKGHMPIVFNPYDDYVVPEERCFKLSMLAGDLLATITYAGNPDFEARTTIPDAVLDRC